MLAWYEVRLLSQSLLQMATISNQKTFGQGSVFCMHHLFGCSTISGLSRSLLRAVLKDPWHPQCRFGRFGLLSFGNLSITPYTDEWLKVSVSRPCRIVDICGLMTGHLLLPRNNVCRSQVIIREISSGPLSDLHFHKRIGTGHIVLRRSSMIALSQAVHTVNLIHV